MEGHQGAVAPEFELIVEECADVRPLPGFHVTRTRTFFVDNYGQVYLLAAPGHRAMLQRQDKLPADAEPTRDIADPDLWMMARAAASIGKGGREMSPLTLADYYAWRTRLFRVQGSQVFELKRGETVRFEIVAGLPAGAVPFTEAEAEQLGQDIHEAAGRIAAS